MRRSFFIFSSAIFLFVGCKENNSRKVDADDDAPETRNSAKLETVTFREGKGVHVPDEIKKYLGVKTTDVAERKFASEITMSVEVFRFGTKTTLASGYVSKGDAQNLKAGQEVILRSKNSDALIRGKLRSIEENKLQSTGLMEAIVEIGSAGLNANIGTAFEAIFATNRTEPVIAIPSEALIKTVEGSFVYVVNGEDFFRTQVKAGGKHEGFVEIEDGLYAGDQVVTQPTMKLWLAELQSIRGGKACADGD